jgi:predicted DNA-binding transcriptional regulator YafY
MRADRLLLLVALLRQRGRMSAGELATRLEVDRRTVLRDVEALATAGIPIYAERGRHGGFALLPGYVPDATELTATEATALLASGGHEAMERLGLGPALASALRKLGATLPAELEATVSHASERLVVDAAGWSQGSATLPQLEPVQRAVFLDRRLRFGYTPRPPRQPGTRTVDPYGLLLAGATWYLVAGHRGQPRSYRVSRMADVRVLDQPSRRPPDLDLRSLWREMRTAYDEQPGPVISVRVPNRWLELVLTGLAGQLSGAPVLTADGEHTVIEARTHVQRGVAGVLAGYGAMVEVLEPPELKAIMLKIGQELVERYADRPRITAGRVPG